MGCGLTKSGDFVQSYIYVIDENISRTKCPAWVCDKNELCGSGRSSKKLILQFWSHCEIRSFAKAENNLLSEYFRNGVRRTSGMVSKCFRIFHPAYTSTCIPLSVDRPRFNRNDNILFLLKKTPYLSSRSASRRRSDLLGYVKVKGLLTPFLFVYV